MIRTEEMLDTLRKFATRIQNAAGLPNRLSLLKDLSFCTLTKSDFDIPAAFQFAGAHKSLRSTAIASKH
ncbi:MAG: hypothetical protein CXZ00_13215 [Acidobacteria bacterium]|nr:MAG: hypothetical protein CXZ00_13215 [Acidobacteriota bacterium]